MGDEEGKLKMLESMEDMEKNDLNSLAATFDGKWHLHN